MILGEADGPQPHDHLTEEMSDPGICIPPPDVDEPAPEDGRVDQRLAPESRCDAGMLLAKPPERLVLDKADLARRDRAYTVVENWKVEALQVRHVAWDVKVHDLALAIAGDGIRDAEPVQEDEGS